MSSYGCCWERDPVTKGVKFTVGPWHWIPPPYVLVMYGPCKTWMAWLVTEPDEFAIGDAVADTPPTSLAFTGVANSNAITAGRYL